MNAFREFLQYAVEVGKLSNDYKLYGESQMFGSSSKPDKLEEALANPPFGAHFDKSSVIFGTSDSKLYLDKLFPKKENKYDRFYYIDMQ